MSIIRISNGVEFHMWFDPDSMLVFMMVGPLIDNSVSATFNAFATIESSEAEIGFLEDLVIHKSEAAWGWDTAKKLMSQAIEKLQEKKRSIAAWKPTCMDCGEELLEDSEIFYGTCFECQKAVAA